jgi:hypothetical protein
MVGLFSASGALDIGDVRRIVAMARLGAAANVGRVMEA